jgi:hypothetical protein
VASVVQARFPHAGGFEDGLPLAVVRRRVGGLAGGLREDPLPVVPQVGRDLP